MKEIKSGEFKSSGYIIVKMNDQIADDGNGVIKALKHAKSEGVFVRAASPQGHVEYVALPSTD